MPRVRDHRRGPLWLLESSSTALHAIAGRFNRERPLHDLTEAQEWLYDRCIEELEYRRRHARPIWSSCSCELCVPPFYFD